MQEKWIIGLVAVQAVLFLCAIFLRRNTALQATIFFTASERQQPCALAHACLVMTQSFCCHLSFSILCLVSLCVCVAAVVFCAERLNSLGGQHWRSFARQPYFDPHGIFTSTLLSAPLLLTMFVILINYLVAASQLLIQMKRKELMYKARERHRQEQGDGGGADTKKKK